MTAAISAFFEHGYHGTSIREIANRSGFALSALYHYYGSKQELLADIVNGFMLGSIDAIHVAVDEAGPDVERRLRAAARTHVLRNAENLALSFVTNSEIRSLEPENRVRHIKHRDAIQAIFDDLIEEGRRDGTFDVRFPKDVSRAIVTMCTSVATWFQPTGPLSPTEVAARYADFAARLAGR